MPQIGLHEDEHHEFKEQWTPRALEDLAAFANCEGGTLWVGVRDDGEIAGCTLDDAEYQRIVNQIVDLLGLRPSVHREEENGLPVLRIVVSPAQMPVGYKGRYLTRVGSTNRDMSPEQLARRALEQSGQTWDRLLSAWGLDAVDEGLVIRFLRLARPRLPQARDEDDVARTLQNLELAREGRLTNAAVLLFTPAPQRLFPLAQVRIGRFRGAANIVDSHDFTGALWDQVDGAMERFRAMLNVRFVVKSEEASLEGLQRREVWEYPLDALREALLNALIHRDYTVTADVQIRVHDDRLSIWSPGELPADLRPEQLYQPGHPSILRNPLIAQVFYYAGFIERWGSGTTRILDLCAEQDLPTPAFEEYTGGVNVIFYQDPYTPARLRELGVSERQQRMVEIMSERGQVQMGDLSPLFPDLSDKTIQRDMRDLVERGLVRALGERKGRRYELVR